MEIIAQANHIQINPYPVKAVIGSGPKAKVQAQKENVKPQMVQRDEEAGVMGQGQEQVQTQELIGRMQKDIERRRNQQKQYLKIVEEREKKALVKKSPIKTH